MAGTSIRVLIADDNRAVRKGLRAQLHAAGGITVMGEVSNGADAVAVASAEQVDVILMDVEMPGLSGLEATKLLSRFPSPPAIIILTGHVVDGYVTEALDSGAVGYLLKGQDSGLLVEAVRGAADGRATVSSYAAGSLLREFVKRGSPAEDAHLAELLTASERRVIGVLASGVTRSESIAEHLSVSIHTVRSHSQAAMNKMGLTDRTQLALWGLRNGLAEGVAHDDPGLDAMPPRAAGETER